jgi:uncharacterized membrane protein YGL010W
MPNHASDSRPIERYFASYSGDHRHSVNQRIHVVAVPLILWSVVGLLWCVPVAGNWLRSGVWAALAMFAAWAFYNRLSRALGLGMLAVFFFFGCLCRLLETHLGLHGLLALAGGVFVVAWVAQFIGHTYEGRKPSFLTDLTYLLIGPAWVLAKVYRQLRMKAARRIAKVAAGRLQIEHQVIAHAQHCGMAEATQAAAGMGHTQCPGKQHRWHPVQARRR